MGPLTDYSSSTKCQRYELNKQQQTVLIPKRSVRPAPRLWSYHRRRSASGCNIRHVRILDAQLNIEQWRLAGEPRRNGFLPGSSSKTRRRADAE